MQVELSPEVVAAAEAVVATGRCASVDEAVRLAFQALAEGEGGMDRFFAALKADPEWTDEIRRSLAEGLADADAGRVVAADQVFFESIKRRGREQLAERRILRG